MIGRMESNVSMLLKFLQAYFYVINNKVACRQNLYVELDVAHLKLLRKILGQFNSYIHIFLANFKPH